jgi:hypothetical protein
MNEEKSNRSSNGNTGAAESESVPAMMSVPTTKILAIGRWTARGSERAARIPVMPLEVFNTVGLYLTGKIDQWYFKTDGSGVVFIMNVTDQEEAHQLLEKLPLGQAGMMAFDFIPLGPLSPLRLLLKQSS